MKLSKNSKELMTFFTKNKHINIKPQTKQTEHIITGLYDDIFDAYNYLNSLKQKGNYFTVSIKRILTARQISKPQNFNSKSFPEIVRNHIDELMMSEICYSFSLYDRNVKVYFTVENDNIELEIEQYNKYIQNIATWLYILNMYASKECAKTLNIYFY